MSKPRTGKRSFLESKCQPRRRKKRKAAAAAPKVKPPKKQPIFSGKFEKNERMLYQIMTGEAKDTLSQLVKTKGFWETHDAWLDLIPECPSFRPTLRQFSNMENYMKTLEKDLEQFGIVKVHAPNGWWPRLKSLPLNIQCRTQKMADFWTSRNSNMPGLAGLLDQVSGETQSSKIQLDMLRKHAERKHKEIGVDTNNLDPSQMEKLYWRMFTKESYNVRYGNDETGSIFWCDALLRDHFPKTDETEDGTRRRVEQCECLGWGLNCLPQHTYLKYLQTISPGINFPMLYIATCFSSFCWHVEDSCLSSINYHHRGSTRTWYSVPNKYIDNFYNVIKDVRFSESFDKKISRQSLIQKNTMISPVTFASSRVPVCKATQGPRDFIITHPGAHHAGFSHGYAVCEAVNFAMESWLPWGIKTSGLYREMKRLPVIPVTLVNILLASELKQAAKPYPPELTSVLQEVWKEEQHCRVKWLDNGADFIQEEQPIEKYVLDMCDICRAHLWPSYMKCRCDKESLFCLRHTMKDLKNAHECKLEDGPRWLVQTLCTGKTFQRLCRSE